MKRAKQSPTKKKPANEDASTCNPPKKQKKAKNYIKTGDIGTFFITKTLGNEHLLGRVPTKFNEESSKVLDNLNCISKFLSEYQAMSTLSDNSTANIAYYLPTIREFEQTQFDRQSAGLRTKKNSNNAEEMTKIVEGHKNALKAAIEDAQHHREMVFVGLFPDKIRLCRWHGLLFGKEISNFRFTNARAGRTVFCHPKDIDTENLRFEQAIISIFHQWKEIIFQTNSYSSIYYSVGLAAIALYGISDIHMFSDGNGRLSRICANWMLTRTLGLPFTITLSANEQQRSEYIHAVKLALKSIQDASQREIEPSGIFKPLVHLLLDRIAHAVQECQRKLTEKSRAAVEEDEARIARRVRERAAQGHCIICLEEHPNIATLCCGQAVHLNCVAKWLVTAPNCVGCRAPLPPMRIQQPPAPAPAARAAASQMPRSILRIASEGEASNEIFLRAMGLRIRTADEGEGEDATTTYTDDEEDPDTTTSMDNDEDDEEENLDTSTFTDDDEDDGTSTNMYADEDDEEDGDTTTMVSCNYPGCNNIPAMDCENGYCGRCCRDYGFHTFCARHHSTETFYFSE